MVLAGSSPAPSITGDPIAHVHKGTTFVILIDAAVICYLFYSMLYSLGFLPSATARTFFLAASLFSIFSVHQGYRARKSWAYWVAVAILFVASLMFFFLALLNVMESVMTGGITGIIFAFLMGWAGLGSGRRAVFHWHPAYRSGYHQLNPMTQFSLEDGEMLAACPTCLAVLAIRPAMLGKSDRCPHCGNNLVSKEVLQRYTTEDE